MRIAHVRHLTRSGGLFQNAAATRLFQTSACDVLQTALLAEGSTRSRNTERSFNGAKLARLSAVSLAPVRSRSLTVDHSGLCTSGCLHSVRHSTQHSFGCSDKYYRARPSGQCHPRLLRAAPPGAIGRGPGKRGRPFEGIPTNGER